MKIVIIYCPSGISELEMYGHKMTVNVDQSY